MIPLPPAVSPPVSTVPLREAPSIPGEHVREVATPRGARVRFLLSMPDERPCGAVLLFPGDTGNMTLELDGRMAWGEKNFLVRSRHLFRAQSFIVAVVDAPSDHLTEFGLYGFRSNPDHAADISAVISALRALADVPSWLVGTSRGTESVACAAACLGPAQVGGAVLSSTVTRETLEDRNRPGSVYDIALDRIEVPVLLVHHRDDACAQTPVGDLPALRTRLTAAADVETLVFAGGLAPEGDPCRPFHYHGFYGIEAPVVSEIGVRIHRRLPAVRA